MTTAPDDFQRLLKEAANDCRPSAAAKSIDLGVDDGSGTLPAEFDHARPGHERAFYHPDSRAA